MKRVLLFFILLTTLTGCSSEGGEELLENKYQDCTVETCSKEMLINRIEVSATTTDGYKGESKDAEEALVKLYGVTYKEVKELKNLQVGIDNREARILDGDIYFSVDKYVNAIMKCGIDCSSNLVTYDEIKDLATDDAMELVKERQKEYADSLNVDATEEVKEEPKQPTTEKGTCKILTNSYTSQGLKITSCRYGYRGDISITVQNNSGVDLRYIEVEIYGINENGKTILSDFTNHGSTIRDGASQTLETHIDYAHSYEVAITKATPR